MTYLQLEYIALTLLMVVWVCLLIRFVQSRAVNTGGSSMSAIARFVVPLFLWFGAIFAVASTGFFQSYELPPRIALIIFGAFGFIFWFVRKNRNTDWLMLIPPSLLIGAQSFRILVETVIYHTYLAGIGPIESTFKGYNYEMYVGISAIIVALLYRYKVIGNQLAIAWNFIGLCFLGIIIFIFVSSSYFPHLWGESESMMSLEFPTFPYLLLPAFLMPLAVFMHCLSIVQLKKMNAEWRETA